MEQPLSYSTLSVYIQRIKDDQLRKGVSDYLMEYWDSMSKAPASRSFHHAYTGGLLNHIIEVCWIGERIIDACSLDVNKDHYFAAALLHDIGKAKLYRKNDEGKWEHVPQEKRLDHSLKPILEFTIKTGVCLPEEVQVAILGHMGVSLARRVDELAHQLLGLGTCPPVQPDDSWSQGDTLSVHRYDSQHLGGEDHAQYIFGRHLALGQKALGAIGDGPPPVLWFLLSPMGLGVMHFVALESTAKDPPLWVC